MQLPPVRTGRDWSTSTPRSVSPGNRPLSELGWQDRGTHHMSLWHPVGPRDVTTDVTKLGSSLVPKGCSQGKPNTRHERILSK